MTFMLIYFLHAAVYLLPPASWYPDLPVSPVSSHLISVVTGSVSWVGFSLEGKQIPAPPPDLTHVTGLADP